MAVKKEESVFIPAINIQHATIKLVGDSMYGMAGQVRLGR